MMEVWGVAEFSFAGYQDKNPFTDYTIYGEFSCEQETKTVAGFYDGDGVYRVRFMPSFAGEYQYRVWGSFSDQEYTGSFIAEEPTSHGMVKADGVHFSYSDGAPYYSVGTTCYGWANQSAELRKKTIETLKDSAFNKIRFCVFPKHYDYNYRDPFMFPYVGTPVDNSAIDKYNFFEYNENTEGNDWDFSRFNVEYFKVLDSCVENLMQLGIEADIILFHPYDRWGFSKMPDWADDLYLQYVIARLGAYRNVWWSLANEYELCAHKQPEHWEHYAQVIGEHDVYGHLIGVHNCFTQYDHAKPWVTHCSVQRQNGELELEFIPNWIEKFQKPVVIDEMCYEGNIDHCWGNISGEEMLRRMWKTVILGGYPGHSECYRNENIWWSHGGILYGESHKRFGFLHKIMTECGRLHSTAYTHAENEDGTVKLQYFGEHRPSYQVLNLGEEKYKIEIIDTWNMTIEDKGICTGTVTFDMPGNAFMAIRWTKQ